MGFISAFQGLIEMNRNRDGREDDEAYGGGGGKKKN
jgi:hypothetical protein